jgi:hypothetical protein
MLEMVQQASFLMLFFWLVLSRCSRQVSALQLMITCARARCTDLVSKGCAHHLLEGEW